MSLGWLAGIVMLVTWTLVALDLEAGPKRHAVIRGIAIVAAVLIGAIIFFGLFSGGPFSDPDSRWW
jgi:hypothetical protein